MGLQITSVIKIAFLRIMVVEDRILRDCLKIKPPNKYKGFIIEFINMIVQTIEKLLEVQIGFFQRDGMGISVVQSHAEMLNKIECNSC